MNDMSAMPLVLLVEDQPLLLLEAEDILKQQHFQVISAVNGNEGLSELDRDATRFSAVITDVRLGDGPNGWDVARHARELVPAMPVVYVTADSADEWAANGVPESILIAKPFVPAQLVMAIATLLNQQTVSHATGNMPAPDQ
ncbi:response regulator [Neorhizobium sp. S3-V5DH]|uniref:response regulator n=1 Tax=Neorhizobium sp. S3-V5DH TaxID=2485166 RepID=UPI0010F02145|nr:response regulator [Neorhizobium sp. S3-V5DH]TCV75934.1 response regulator receiver domain-containing protein [Neorhizobium sp. S3-V5DH]